MGLRNLIVDNWQAATGGVVIMIATIVGAWGVGELSGVEARQLLETMNPTTRFLCSAVMTATATILALMLTLLGMTQNTDRRLNPAFFSRIKTIANVGAGAFLSATVILLLINMPLKESSAFSREWFTIVYYVQLIASSALAGSLIAVVLMLRSAITTVLDLFNPHVDSDLLVEQDGRVQD